MAKLTDINPNTQLLQEDSTYIRAGDNKDPGKTPAVIGPALNDDGTPEENSSGHALVNEENIDYLVAEGRLKPSDAQAAKERIKQQKALAAEGKDFTDVSTKTEDPVTKEPILEQKQDNTGPVVPTYVATEPPKPQIPGGIPSANKVKLLSANPQNNILMGQGLMKPLTKTGFGIVFPYTPTIMWNYSTNYGSYETTHSVYQQQYWSNTPNPTIQITATFTATTLEESAYTLASLHFLRWATKGDFGSFLTEETRNPTAGSPPPVLIFNAYGAGNAQNIPVVIRGVNYTYGEDVDFVTVGGNPDAVSGRTINGIYYSHNEIQEMNRSATEFNEGEYGAVRQPNFTTDFKTSIPVQFVLSIDLAVQQTPNRVENAFNIREYQTGKALTKGFN